MSGLSKNWTKSFICLLILFKIPDMKIITITVEELAELIDDRLRKAFQDFLALQNKKPDEYISRLDLAKKFGKSPETIDKWEKWGQLPRAIKLGRKKFFLMAEVEEKINNKRNI